MNKKILRTLTAFCAALMLMGGFSVTAFAQTPEQPAADATNDSGVIYEEPEKPHPLRRRGTRPLLTISAAISSLSLLLPKPGTIFISSLTGTTRAKTPYIS